MTALGILGAVLVILVLISFIRVGGAVEYSAQGLFVRVLAGPLRLTVYPFPERKKRRQRKENPKKQKAEPPKEGPEQSGGSLALVKQFLPLVADAANHMRRKIRIDRLDLDLTVAAPDPALAAMSFGGANAALGMLIPPLENNFNIKERNIRTAVDFGRKTPVVAIRAALTLTIGQGLAFAFHFGVRALKILTAHKKGQGAKTE